MNEMIKYILAILNIKADSSFVIADISEELESIADIVDYKNFIKKNFNYETKQLINIIDYLIKNFNKEIKNYQDLFNVLDHTYSKIVELSNIANLQKKQSSLGFSLLKGTISHAYSTIYTFALASKDKNRSIHSINISFKEIIKFLLTVKKDIRGIKID